MDVMKMDTTKVDKIRDLTIGKLLDYCATNVCESCAFHYDRNDCPFDSVPFLWDVEMIEEMYKNADRV